MTTPAILKQYQEYLDRAAGLCDPSSQPIPIPSSLRVGIIGAGMSGLYSALLLQKHFPGVKVKIFEASNRVGGNVHTHRISPEPNQFAELGAIRFPQVESQRPVFDLISYLNSLFPEVPMELIDFRYYSEGNRVFFNNTKQRDGRIMSHEYACKHYTELGFLGADCEAGELFSDSFTPVIEAFERNFEEALAKYKDMSIRYYLSHELGWSHDKIDYVEGMVIQSNMFDSGLLECFFWNPGPKANYKTIDGGMARLPQLCAQAIEKKNGVVLLNAKVESIVECGAFTRIGYSQPQSKELTDEVFDAVFVTIPMPFIRQIQERPHFGIERESAFRLCYSRSCTKFVLRFHSRFWERNDLQHPPSFGGQSTTDLPIRWLLYPNWGIGKAEKGVLGVYNWSTDSSHWHLMSKEDKIKTTLHNIQALYPEVDVAKEYAGGEPDSEEFLKEAFEMNFWGMTWYNAGQFQRYFPSLVHPHGNIYFAGSHLSSALAWVMSAVESARRAVRQLAMKYGIENVDYLT